MARFTGGWIKLFRSVLDKEEISDQLEIFGIWANLLLMANYKETKKDWGKGFRTFPPGSILLGVKELSLRWNLSRDTILRRLRYLEKWGCIQVETAELGTVVTICNWKEYQEDQKNVAEDVRSICVTSAEDLRKSPTLSEEEKKERREKKERKNTGIRVQYPTDFEDFWKLYGMKGDKKVSFEEYKNLKLTEEESNKLPVAIRNYQIQNPERKFRKDFQRFLKMDWRPLVNPAKELNGVHPKTQERLNTLERYKSQVENLENGGSDYES
jgi:DNA-binding transcriptional regulator YhcF (GntR family)